MTNEEREAVKKLMIKYGFKAPDMTVTEFVEDCLPSVTPTRPTGKWIDIQYFKADDTYYRPKCPFCSIEPKEYSNFCPNCGAKMVESEGKE